MTGLSGLLHVLSLADRLQLIHDHIVKPITNTIRNEADNLEPEIKEVTRQLNRIANALDGIKRELERRNG